jgi:hypothetical protein
MVFVFGLDVGFVLKPWEPAGGAGGGSNNGTGETGGLRQACFES